MSIYSLGEVNSFYLNSSVHIPLNPQVNLTIQFQTGILQACVTRKEIDPHTLIHRAILENNPPVIEFLLKQGVDVNYPDENGMTPLTIAILNRCNYAVDTLLQHGADVNPSVKWNNKPLFELARDMEGLDFAKKLIVHGVTHGIDPNAKVFGETSLLSQTIDFIKDDSARKDEWSSIARKLIENGAEIHKFSYLDCPLMSAVYTAEKSKDYSILQLLIEKGINLNAASICKGKEFETPLMVAAQKGDLDLVKFLVEAGADINRAIINGHKSSNMCTPMTEALSWKRSLVVQYLLQHGAKSKYQEEKAVTISSISTPYLYNSQILSAARNEC